MIHFNVWQNSLQIKKKKLIKKKKNEALLSGPRCYEHCHITDCYVLFWKGVFRFNERKSFGANVTTWKSYWLLNMHDSAEWMKQWTGTGLRDQWSFAALSEVTPSPYSDAARQALSFLIWPLLLWKIQAYLEESEAQRSWVAQGPPAGNSES